jgi:hypothetical protein
MKLGKYKNIHDVKVYEDGKCWIIEFHNGATITVSDLSDVVFNK